METRQHLRAILLLPLIVTVVIPGVIVWLTGSDTLEMWQSASAPRVALPVLGGAVLCLGLVLMVATIRLFVTRGKGTWLRGIRPSALWSRASTGMSAIR